MDVHMIHSPGGPAPDGLDERAEVSLVVRVVARAGREVVALPEPASPKSAGAAEELKKERSTQDLYPSRRKKRRASPRRK